MVTPYDHYYLQANQAGAIKMSRIFTNFAVANSTNEKISNPSNQRKLSLIRNKNVRISVNLSPFEQ